MNYSQFLNISLDFASYNRRYLCDYEHRIITSLMNIRRGLLPYRSYDLLMAGLFSSHLPLSSSLNKNSASFYPLSWLEFGVYGGRSVNYTSFTLQQRFQNTSKGAGFHVYGFDNFTGLPVDWGGWKQGAFSTDGKIPPVESHVTLVKGLIEDSLPAFLADEKHSCKKISSGKQSLRSKFSHSGTNNNSLNLLGMNIDTDLYSGSYKALELLYPCMKKGVLIHFHELFPHDPSTPKDELRSLFDFAANYSISLELLPYKSGLVEAALVKVVNIPNPRQRRYEKLTSS
jgi:hypothetical protein